MQALCFLSAVAMRSEPSDRAEMVNQLLLGDTFEIVEQQPNWSLVRCTFDGYQGWVDNKQWMPLEAYAAPPTAAPAAPLSQSPGRVAQEVYLGAPYLWGGRTPQGIDCSGLTQMCFKACGIALPRDASQQATKGNPVATLSDAHEDDLCFFSNPDGRIVHVGIYLGGGRIIHASGQVRIDTLTPQGIVNASPRGSLNLSPATHQLTHTLHSIRRLR